MKIMHDRKSDENELINFIEKQTDLPDEIKGALKRLKNCNKKELMDYSSFETIEE